MSLSLIVWGKLICAFICYFLLGWLFAWTPLWAEALQYNDVLQHSLAFTLSRIALIVLTLTLTLSFAWNKFGVMSWAKSLGWCYILSHGVAGILLLVFGGGITLYVVWLVVISVAWAGAFSLVGTRNQLLLSFSRLHALTILGFTSIFGLSLGGLVRLINP
jgi:hypothetical protein